MPQRKSSLYNLINNPLVYKIIQKLMSGTSFRANIVRKKIKKKNSKILDIGCGPAEILESIPRCEYYGYDIDSRSIRYAKKKYIKQNYHFFNKKFSKKEVKKLPKFDYIIFFGILHHLDKKEIHTILKLCKKKMKKNCKLLSEDPVLVDDQNIIAKYLIMNDRGKNVRTKKEYINILSKHFKTVQSKITQQNFIPYTWFTTVCKK
mgnify:FL=1